MIDLKILKKLEGKKFKIDFHKLDSTVYLIAENLTIKIKSNQYLMISLDGAKEPEYKCTNVKEVWNSLFNVYLMGFEFRLENGSLLFIETSIGAKLEVTEVKDE